MIRRWENYGWRVRIRHYPRRIRGDYYFAEPWQVVPLLRLRRMAHVGGRLGWFHSCVTQPDDNRTVDDVKWDLQMLLAVAPVAYKRT